MLCAATANAAPQIVNIYTDIADNCIVTLHYDDQTLQATTISFSVDQGLGTPLIFNMVSSGINAGAAISFQAPPSINQATYTFPAALQGSLVTTKFGTSINWGITSMGGGAKGVVSPNGSTIIHAHPNG